MLRFAFVYIFFIFSISLTTTVEAGLAERWVISDPIFAYNRANFVLDYTVNDFIDVATMASYSFWDSADCQEGGNRLAEGRGLTASLSGNHTEAGVGLGTRRIKLNINVHSPDVEETAIFTERNETGYRVGYIQFCARFMLSTPQGIEVNFQETIVGLRIDFSSGFAIDELNVEPRARDSRSERKEYKVVSYDCSSTTANQDDTKNQGTVLRVCIEPNADALSDGIKMRSIDEYYFVKGDNRQNAVVNKEEASNGLTRLTCKSGSAQCTVQTILNANFFKTNGTVDGIGFATMQFGTSEAIESTRRLQESNPEGGESDGDGDSGAGSYELFVKLALDGSPVQLTSWWFATNGPASPAEIANYCLFVLCVMAVTMLVVQHKSFKGSFFYL